MSKPKLTYEKLLYKYNTLKIAFVYSCIALMLFAAMIVTLVEQKQMWRNHANDLAKSSYSCPTSPR